jgi:beta-lactamase class A
MSKPMLSLLAGMFAVSAFAADTAFLPAPQPKPVVIAPTVAVPAVQEAAPAPVAKVPIAKMKASKAKSVKKHVVKKGKKLRHSA